MIGKQLGDITQDDIHALIADTVAESRTLEYKQELPGNGDEDKREFLADVSSFANASGGDILYGIVERRDENGRPTGEPEDAPGLNIANIDAEIRRLDNIIRDGIDPRVPVIHLRPINGFAQGPVVLIRILQSWVLPHMVTYRGLSRFYSRNSAGKYPLDVAELRSAFLLSNEWSDRVRRFRDQRIARIVSGESCCPLSEGAKLVMHLVPIGAASSDAQQYIASMVEDDWRQLRPITEGITGYRHNIDGLVVFAKPAQDEAYTSYVQLFRNGGIESVSVGRDGRDPGVIDSQDLEARLIGRYDMYTELQRRLSLNVPVVLMLTLIGVEGYSVRPGEHWRWDDEDIARFRIDRDLLLLPDIIIEERGREPSDVVLRPVFDALWQASGWDSCKNYNENGRHSSVAAA